MAVTKRIYYTSAESTYTVTVALAQTALHDGNSGQNEVYLKINTNMTTPDGTAIGPYSVRDLTDVPTGYSTASDFTELINDYIEYFQQLAELIVSSSSSSSSTSSSSSSSYGVTSSSSSSSYGVTSSSSSSSYGVTSSSSSSSYGVTSSSSSSSYGVTSSSSSSSSSYGVTSSSSSSSSSS